MAGNRRVSDRTKIYDSLGNDIEYPFQVVVLSGTVASSDLITRIDYPTTTITYYGQAEQGSTITTASWAIKRITELSSTVQDILLATNYSSSSDIWDNRASLDYS